MNIETQPGADKNQTLELIRTDCGKRIVVRVIDAALGERKTYMINVDPQGLPSHTWGYETRRGRFVAGAKSEAEALDQIRAHLARNPHI